MGCTKVNKIIFALIAVFVIAASAYGASAYEIDNSQYRLKVSSVSVESRDTLQFYLVNPINTAYQFTDLHSYSIEISDEKSSGKFSHSEGGSLYVSGKLDFAEKTVMTLPFDTSGLQTLECNEPITVELYTFKGATAARYVGIPTCNIRAERKLGLLNTANCSAEYFDGTLKIVWALTGSDSSEKKVMLRKTVGRNAAVEGWYGTDDCPDLESGKCMTVLSSIKFVSGNASVVLLDKRKGTSVTLSNVADLTSCGKASVATKTSTSTTESSTSAAATTASTASTATNTNITTAAAATTAAVATTTNASTTSTNSSGIYLLKANAASSARTCLEGCSAEGQCYDEGTRASYLGVSVYCKGMDWMVQKANAKSCTSDYECSSQICDNSVCASKKSETVKQSWITRMLGWVDNLI
jgi:hypothetical protein